MLHVELMPWVWACLLSVRRPAIAEAAAAAVALTVTAVAQAAAATAVFVSNHARTSNVCFS